MAFDGSKFARLSGHDRTDIPKEYAYYTNDTLAVVLGASYFDDLVDQTRLSEGDRIYCRFDVDGTPGVRTLFVTDISAAGVVTVTPEYLEGSKTHDWGDIAAAAQESTTVTVTGAALGDLVSASMSVNIAGAGTPMMDAQVTATDTVTVTLANLHAANALSIASGTLKVRVSKSITF